MNDLQDIVRAKVDEMRDASYAENHSRSAVIGKLADTGEMTSSPDNADRHNAAAHMCPYSTCGNTRHG